MSDVSVQTMIFGYGYLGRRVAQQAIRNGDKVYATTRRPQRQEQLATEGTHPIVADWTDRRTLANLPDVKQIVICVSYDRHSSHNRFDSQVGGLRNLLQVINPKTKICYISTTGVYHQQNGVWVDETSPTRPHRDGGRAHLMAEALLNQMRPESEWTILRLSGIYGPGRIPRAANIIAGRPIASPREGFLNLIHVEDAAQAVDSVFRKRTQRLYVVSDDRPIVRSQFYEEIARQTGSEKPQFVTAEAGSSVSIRSESNKRVWNRRMKRDLVSNLYFPTYQHGLADIL